MLRDLIMIGQSDRRASAAVQIRFDSQHRRLLIYAKIDVNIYRGGIEVQFSNAAKTAVIKTFLNDGDIVLDDRLIIYRPRMLDELLEKTRQSHLQFFLGNIDPAELLKIQLPLVDCGDRYGIPTIITPQR